MRTREQNTIAQIAHDTAYFVLSRRAHSEIKELQSEFDESPDVWAMCYFTETAKGRGVRPNADYLRAMRGHTGRLETRHDFIVVEFPSIPAVDLLADLSDGLATGCVLAPYFSAAVIDRGSSEVHYFVLGQSPDAQTMLRRFSATMNVNLGPGCEPELKAFLKLLWKQFTES
jgi:hypothetical protein